MLRGNKLLLALLLPVFVLALCFTAFALDDGDIIIINGEHFTPDEWAAKQNQANASKTLTTDVEKPMVAHAPIDGVNDNDPTLKYNPRISAGVDKAAPETNLLFESFESGVMPPTGWTRIQTNDSTWQIGDISPYDGMYKAHVLYDDTYSGDQDEWLVSPAVDLTTGGTTWFLDFYWNMSYYWGVSPYDNYDMEVWISTDGGTTFSTMLWTEPTTTFTNYTWYEVTIDLTPYLTETNVAFGFHYAGYDGAEGAIDYVSVNDAAPPDGRCCFGDALAPDCAVETESLCMDRPDFLSWTEGITCASPCPIVGEGDNCGNPIVATLPADFVSNQYINTNYTCGRGNDYEGVTCMASYDGGEDIMYEIVVTEDVYVNITVDPKGTTYAGFALGTECPPSNCLVNVANSYNSTPFGANNVILPAGTYYLMVDTWPAPDCIPDFDLKIDYLGVPPAAPANDQCSDAELIPGPFPQTVTGSTVSSTLDCPGVLDWQSVWYTFDNPYGCANVTIDYCGTTPSLVTVGVVLFPDCSCSGYTLHSNTTWDECDGNPTSYWNGLPAGTYYYPAFTGPGTYGGQTQDFTLTLDVQECPPPPDNDNCSGAVPVTLGVPVSGTTNGATADCPALFTDWYGVWYSFDLNSATNCNNVSASYCGSSGTSPSTVSATLIAENSEADCCDASSQYFYTSGAFDCPNGWPQIYWENIPNGSYYYIVAFADGINTYDFTLTMNANECPPPEPGDNCTNPLKVTIGGSGDLPYVDNNFTCGRGNSASNTCLDYYDSGEDIFYEITVNSSMTLDFNLDPQGTTYAGMALGTSCPPSGTTYSDCLAEVHSSSASPKGFQFDATPGTYYLMIDTWASPDCIPAFTLTINEYVPTPGDNCSDPIKVNLPSDSPYSDLDNYTCNRGDNYDATCMGFYDGGEDIHYEINVDEAGYYEFTLDPKGTTYAGMGLGETCPIGDPCLAQVHYSYSDGAVPIGFRVFLAPGTYYLMVDTWPSPDCIPDFDLFINYLAPPELTWDKTIVEFCDVQPGDNGCQTLNLGNLGDIDLEYSCVPQYGVPATKEIDGANIVASPTLYVPGQTVDITFTATNASSDAEWIDSIAITFPAGVTVNTSSDFTVVSGGGTYLLYDGTTGDNTTVSWGNWNGGYGNIYSTAVAEATINISFGAELSGPIVLNYHISGDNFGATPHDLDGSIVLSEDNPLTNWLSISPASGTISGGGNQPVQVCYNTAGLPDDTYHAMIYITHNGGLSPIMIPVTLQIGPDHDPAAVIAIDKSGSMALTDAFGATRFERAKALAHTDADDLLGQGYMVAVMQFNADGIIMLEDFTTDATAIHDAIDGIAEPQHDTPLAAAMCQAHCTLNQLGCGVDALYTYTDGEENESLEYDMCYICDHCYRYHDTGWNFDCDPNNPASCTEWQMCLSDLFTANGVNMVNYFGAPINPFVKGAAVPQDMYFLKYTADASDGEFHYFADAAFVPGDANGDGSINVSDAVYVINYVFVAGQAPMPLEAGDANCDSRVNVSDAVYIINYVFVGGPAPADCQ